MNKKMILSIVAIILIAFVTYGLFQAKSLQHIQIVKTVTVKSTPEQAFNMVRYLSNFPKWSPFLAADPAQKYQVKGTDGNVGAQYHWNGNGGKDLGFQEIVKIDSLNYIGMQCDIQKPFVAKPTFEYSFKPTTDGIAITQNFNVKSSMADAFFMWLFGAKAGMDKMNQQGMDLLKVAVEQA